MYITNDILLAVAGTAGFLFIIFIVAVVLLSRRLSRIMIGKKSINIEDSIIAMTAKLKEAEQFIKEMQEYLTTVERRLKSSVQAVETIRFNPFKGTGDGGNQSFSTTFLNQKGEGVVLTSMYSRDRISMFAKPLKNFKSEFELSEEERDSIDRSKKSLNA